MACSLPAPALKAIFNQPNVQHMDVNVKKEWETKDPDDKQHPSSTQLTSEPKSL